MQQDVAVAGSGLVGGETEALRRVQRFVAEASTQMAPTSKAGSAATSDSIYGANFSCKISPWLALGCLSPRRMYEDLRARTTARWGQQKSAVTWNVHIHTRQGWLYLLLAHAGKGTKWLQTDQITMLLLMCFTMCAVRA